MRWSSIFCLFVGCLALILGARSVATHGSSIVTAADVPWPAPSELALNNLGPAVADHNERPYSCTSLTYRMIDDLHKTMQQGCFLETAFGMIDPDQSVVIFNGTDEAEALKEGSIPAALSVLPHSGSVATFGGFPGQGAYMHLYTNFYSTLKTIGNPLTGRAKLISQSPNFTVQTPDGQPLPVNPLALSYSARSQWFVTEVPGRSLVRVNLATFAVTPFAPSLGVPGKPFASQRASMAITENGRYAAVASRDLRSFKVYDLKNCGQISGATALDPQNCRFYDYWPYVEEQVSGSLTDISHVTFIQDGLLSFDVVTGNKRETYLLSPSGPITSLIPYLGLGDSYASGQGAFDYLIGTDTATGRCHVSTRSYPLRLNQSLFGGQGHSVACSGARTHDVGSQNADYTGQNSEQLTAREREADGSEVTILHDFKPGFLAQQRFVTSYQPGVITVQIGGNDIGFGTMLLRCLSPLTLARPPAVNQNSCYQTYEDRLELVESANRSYPKLVQLYKQLAQQSPGSRLYSVGYPQILSSQARCRANVRLTLAEITFAREVTVYINSVVKRASDTAGVTYIDISKALEGHELCSGSTGQLAVNGLTAGNDAYGLGQESFHPTALGHELIERAILQQTNNFAVTPKPSPAGTTPDVTPAEPLLQAPKTGRSTSVLVPGDFVGSSGKVMSPINVRLNGSTYGLVPNTNYVVTIGDRPAGTLRSDANGSITGTVPIPPNTPGGLQPVIISGPGQGAPPITVVDTIYVPVTPTDSDGDGLPDTQDSCPLIANRGEDLNVNSIDDACDNASPEFVPSPTTTPSTAPPTTAVTSPPNSQTVQQEAASPQPAVLLPRGEGRLSFAISTLAAAKPIASRNGARAGKVLGVRTASADTLTNSGRSFSVSPSRQVPVTPLGVFYWYYWLAAAGLVYCALIYSYRKSK